MALMMNGTRRLVRCPTPRRLGNGSFGGAAAWASHRRWPEVGDVPTSRHAGPSASSDCFSVPTSNLRRHCITTVVTGDGQQHTVGAVGSAGSGSGCWLRTSSGSCLYLGAASSRSEGARRWRTLNDHMVDFRRNGHRGGSSALPSLRLEVVLVLMIGSFVLGVYVPTVLSMFKPMSSGSSFPGGRSPAGGHVDIEAVQTQMSRLEEKVVVAEKENDRVRTENEQVRLDNLVEQANLKSLTKAKNEVIRGLESRIKELEGKGNVGEGRKAGVGGEKVEKEWLEDCEKRESKARASLIAAQQERTNLQARIASLEGNGGVDHERKEEADGIVPQEDGSPKAAVERLKEAQIELLPPPPPERILPHWRHTLQGIFEMGRDRPDRLLSVLDNDDPLGVMSISNISDFRCPVKDQLLSQPDLREMERARTFRERGEGFIFFQHLRKAGGTGICDLAKRNMPKGAPPYFCMPDDRGTLMTPPWTSRWLVYLIKEKGYRIVANEWDALSRSKLMLPGAVFLTTLRDPVDRWYSQYRFEHVEKRDASTGELSFLQWYLHNVGYNMGDNYYIKTFVGKENPPDEEVLQERGPKGNPIVHGHFYWTYDKYRQGIEWPQFEAAVDTLRRFHVLLIMEWLDQSDGMLEQVLGWKEKPRQVLPHENQATRETKKSVTAREKLTTDVYEAIRQRNALDTLYYHIARRLFLEHVNNCGATP